MLGLDLWPVEQRACDGRADPDHEPDPIAVREHGGLLDRVAVHEDEIRELALFHSPDAVAEPERLRSARGRRNERVRGAESYPIASRTPASRAARNVRPASSTL